MGQLRDTVAEIKASIAGAFNYGDPVAFVAMQEEKLHTALVDAIEDLQGRVAAIEQHPALSIPPLMSFDPATGEIKQVSGGEPSLPAQTTNTSESATAEAGQPEVAGAAPAGSQEADKQEPQP